MFESDETFPEGFPTAGHISSLEQKIAELPVDGRGLQYFVRPAVEIDRDSKVLLRKFRRLGHYCQSQLSVREGELCNVPFLQERNRIFQHAPGVAVVAQ
jgi:hypothetical protein